VTIQLIALTGIGEVAGGSDLVQVLGEALERSDISLRTNDILVVAQKIVSKAEGRLVDLATVTPSGRAIDLAGITRKDPRVVELILSESVEVMRAIPNVLIVRHRLGLVMANAGIDRSNIGTQSEAALLLPVDPDGSAGRLRAGLLTRFGVAPAVVISDSFGRAWRFGTVNVAIGAAGLPTLVDRRGDRDRDGRVLESTEIALGDAVGAAAGLAMGEADEGQPAVLLRGLTWMAPDSPARSLIRPLKQDLFP